VNRSPPVPEKVTEVPDPMVVKVCAAVAVAIVAPVVENTMSAAIMAARLVMRMIPAFRQGNAGKGLPA
jgi:hypothetical protein